MRRRLAALLLSWALLPLPAACGQGLTRETVDRLKAGTVFLQVHFVDVLTGEPALETGSGFVVHSNGYLVTSWHVLRPWSATEGSPAVEPLDRIRIEVFFGSGTFEERVLEATVAAADEEHDLAVLAVGARGLEALTLGDPASLFETLPVWAVGFPLGRLFGVVEKGPEPTFTGGSVTALRHDDRGRLRMVQADAPLDHGNSGGPLVDGEGRVIGVAQSVLEGRRWMGFAVPAGFVSELVSGLDVERPWAARGRVAFRSAPPGAEVYVDGIHLGRTGETGLEADVPLGLRQVVFSIPGRPRWVRDLSLVEGRAVEARLGSAGPLRIDTPPTGAPALPDPGPGEADLAVERVRELARLGFDSRGELDLVEQSTGSSERPTWYVRDGRLHQHAADELLHAAFFGDPSWTDYSFRADVSIKDAEGDARAGLVFRETADGFYVFRIHRTTRRAQLAYHSKAPFGWFVLGERRLDAELDGEPHRLEVVASGANLVARMDGRTVFAVRSLLSGRGRAGFYAVESRAAFEDAVVEEIAGARDEAEDRGDRFPGFWFVDDFSARSGWWIPCPSGGALPRPWRSGPGGSVVDAGGAEEVAILDRYELTSFFAELAVRFSPSGEAAGGRFGIVFGRRQDLGVEREARLVLSESDARCRLVERAGAQERVLAETPLDEHALQAAFGGRLARVVLQLDGPRASAYLEGRPLLEHRFEGPPPEGRLGLFHAEVRGVLHRLRVTSPQPLGGE